MLSPRQYAQAIERPYTTVMTWLQGGLLPRAKKRSTPTGHFWEIPEGTPPPDLKPGPKPKSESDGEVSTAADAPGDGPPSAVTGKKTKKPRKKGTGQ